MKTKALHFCLALLSLLFAYHFSYADGFLVFCGTPHTFTVISLQPLAIDFFYIYTSNNCLCYTG
jgi:hypothetical protein